MWGCTKLFRDVRGGAKGRERERLRWVAGGARMGKWK